MGPKDPGSSIEVHDVPGKLSSRDKSPLRGMCLLDERISKAVGEAPSDGLIISILKPEGSGGFGGPNDFMLIARSLAFRRKDGPGVEKLQAEGYPFGHVRANIMKDFRPSGARGKPTRIGYAIWTAG